MGISRVGTAQAGAGLRIRPLPLAGLGMLAVWTGLAAAPASATEGGASLYIPGLRSTTAGVVPPPGFYFQNDFYSYFGRIGGSRNLPIGGGVVAGVKQQTWLDLVTPIWVTPVEIFGGNLAFAVTVPFGEPAITASAAVAAPRFGRMFGASLRDRELNFGDPVLQSFVGWHAGKFHWSVGGSLNVPSGSYSQGQLSNVSLNRWIGDIYGAATYLDPDLGLDISGTAGFEINGRNLDTRYDSGNAFHFDFAISKSLTKELSVGLIASHYQQVSDDKGDLIQSFKGRVTAVGGTIGLNLSVAGTPVSARLKVLREVEVENRFRGTIGLFTLSFPLGGASPPAPAPATRPVSKL
jgi:hypothetical protein